MANLSIKLIVSKFSHVNLVVFWPMHALHVYRPRTYYPLIRAAGRHFHCSGRLSLENINSNFVNSLQQRSKQCLYSMVMVQSKKDFFDLILWSIVFRRRNWNVCTHINYWQWIWPLHLTHFVLHTSSEHTYRSGIGAMGSTLRHLGSNGDLGALYIPCTDTHAQTAEGLPMTH